MAETKDLHIEVKDMPIREDRIINMLAYMRGVNKSDVLRVAIIEYANTHLKEIQEGFPPERGKKRGEGGY